MKAYARFSVEAIMDQARGKPGEPVAFLKGDRKVMLAVVKADRLFALLDELRRLRVA